METEKLDIEAAVVARPVALEELGSDGAGGRPLLSNPLDLVQNVKVRLTASLGRAELTVAQLTTLGEGRVISLDKSTEEPVELYLDSKLVGQGELVVVGNQFAVRITRFGTSGR